MGLRLIIEDVEGATTIVPLSDDEVTIGRKGGNTIQLTEQNVSRNHARLRLIDGEWEITDLGSYNGVLVNGAPISEAMSLREGDLIQIGDYHLVLADELDKRTVDMDHPVRAANDDEPLLASSSADLPKLSQEELAALTSGTHRARPGMGLDEDEDDRARAGAGGGLKIVIGAILVGVIGGGAWLAFGGGSSDAPPVAAAEAAQADETKSDQPEPEPPAPEPEPEPEPEPADDDTGVLAETGGEALAAGDGTEPEPADAGEEELTGEPEQAEPEDDAQAPEPETEPAPGPKKKKKKSTKKTSVPEEADDDAVPPPPSGPARTPQQLLADARKAQLAGDASTAYRLAKEAYQADKSQEALQLMGVSACKLGDASKARAAYKKLSGSKKEQLAAVCAGKGIELE